MTPRSSAGWQSSAGNNQRQRQPGWGDEVQDSPVAAEQNEEWLRVNFEDLPGSGRSEGSTAVVGDIDLTYVMLQPRIEETVLAYLDLHEEALILTIDQAMMRSSSCLIISLWTERAIRQAWPSSEHTTTSSTWTSAAFLQLRHEQLKSKRPGVRGPQIPLGPVPQHHRRTRRTSGRSARRTPGTGRRSRVLVANRRS